MPSQVAEGLRRRHEKGAPDERKQPLRPAQVFDRLEHERIVAAAEHNPLLLSAGKKN
jgi:hypothetical protein